MGRVQELALAAGIPVCMAFELDSHPVEAGEAIVVHIVTQGAQRPDGTFVGPKHPGMLVAGNVLGKNPRPELLVLGQRIRTANAMAETGQTPVCGCAGCRRREANAAAEKTGSPSVPPAALAVTVAWQDTALEGLESRHEEIDDADTTRVRGPKELAYDAQIAPSVKHITALAKSLGLPCLIAVELDNLEPASSVVAMANTQYGDIRDARMLALCAMARSDPGDMPPEILACLVNAKQHLEERAAEAPKPDAKASAHTN